MANILKTAIAYLKKGLPVVAADPEKKCPTCKWSQYQETLPTLQQIVAMYNKTPNAMLSIVTGKLSGIIVVDCDTQTAIEHIESLLPESYETLIASTPRGGRHYYFKHNGKKLQTKAGVLAGIDVRSDGGVIVAPPSINITGGRYEWINALDFDKELINYMPDAVYDTLKNGHIREKAEIQRDDTTPLFSVGRRDSDMFTLANALIKAGMQPQDVRKYLDFVVKKSDGIFDPAEHNDTWITTKIQSAMGRKDERERNLAQEIRDWVLTSKGVFTSSDIYSALVLQNRSEKNKLSVYLGRLLDEKLIERAGERNGQFRRIEKEYEVMDLTKEVGGYLPIEWPFGLENKVGMTKKSIAIIAGQTNSGKTAFCLNFALYNMDTMPVRYLTSEMGSVEMKNRLVPMGLSMEEWCKVEFIERANQYHDLILPDGITIIDFMEKSNNFYEIAGDIKTIFDRLVSGVVLIAIQKKAGQDFGRGGEFSAEKARLYLSMSPGKLKITKGKNWVNPMINPNNLEINFKLLHGCKFLEDPAGWNYSTEK